MKVTMPIIPHFIIIRPTIATSNLPSLQPPPNKYYPQTYFSIFLKFMEGQGPMASSMNKFVASEGTVQVPEESGWTQYLEDFSSDQREDSSYSSNGSPSLVSDAASPNTNEIIACPSFSGQQFPKRLNVKKQRTKKYSCDDLEDTASSPVNSPKVSSLRPVDTNHRRADDGISNFLGKESRLDRLQGSDERSMNFDGKNNDYMDLKKKGLCLMPFSMVVNFLG